MIDGGYKTALQQVWSLFFALHTDFTYSTCSQSLFRCYWPVLLVSLTNAVFVLSLQKKKRPSERPTPRKRKFEADVGSERRNPARKARPPENFAVEEKSEPVHVRSPRNINIKRLVEVQYTTHFTLSADIQTHKPTDKFNRKEGLFDWILCTK